MRRKHKFIRNEEQKNNREAKRYPSLPIKQSEKPKYPLQSDEEILKDLPF